MQGGSVGCHDQGGRQCHPGDLLRDIWSLKERHLKNVPINARDALEALLGEVEYEEDSLQEHMTCVGDH